MNRVTDDNRVLVLGGGRFGRLAVERLGERVTQVVEPNPAPELYALGAKVLVRDGIQAAFDILDSADAPPWLVPALPLHFLVEWLCLSLDYLDPEFMDIPRQALPEVAMLHRGESKQWYLSLADFTCPDDCPEPANICTATKKPRGEPMFQRLAGIEMAGCETRVLRSRQLAPGVGALMRDELLLLRKEIIRRGPGAAWVLGTACLCHGVVQAIKLGGAVS
jgi:hypothetical protein